MTVYQEILLLILLGMISAQLFMQAARCNRKLLRAALLILGIVFAAAAVASVIYAVFSAQKLK
ncbi:MAG: hypothetical protein LBS90_04155 [Oscillospiraceae bacterium]|jgi:hypothetical protein|nr:hypothetical protein [Oscillospiraceae bacterium]